MRPGRKRKVTVTLAPVHNRVVTDAPNGAIGIIEEVDDPYEAGAKILAFKNLRDDPLGRYAQRGQIDQAQLTAGRAWQNDYEAAEVGGVGAVDTTKPPVDGRSFPDPVTERQRQAMKRLARDAMELGMLGESLIRDVLGRRMYIEQAAVARGFGNQRSIDYYSRLFRDCLDILAVVRGFAMRSHSTTRA